jgi:hypothetical protein
MEDTTIFCWNKYLETQYIWDGTCGYHAIKNTLNLIYLLNTYHQTSSIINYNINDLLVDCQFIDKLNNRTSVEARNYYIKLNDGKKSTNVNQLKHVINHVDKNNNMYFWDIYDERSELIRLVANKNVGIYGCIIYYEDFLCRHWYGLVIDIISNKTINVHLLDSFGVIFPHSHHLHQILWALNLKNIKYDTNYSKLMTYSYKAYQLMIFIIVYFVIIYGVALLLIRITNLQNRISIDKDN